MNSITISICSIQFKNKTKQTIARISLEIRSPIQQSTKIVIYNCLLHILGHVAATREQLLLQTQKLASRRSEKPPKLPPRDNIYHPHDIPKPDYDDINEDDRLKAFRVKSDKGRDLNKKYGTLIQI